MGNLDRAGLILAGAAFLLLRAAWALCPFPELIKRGSDGIDAADLGTVD